MPNPTKENDGGQAKNGSFGIITQAWYGRRRGLSAGSTAGPGGRHHGRRGFRPDRRPARRTQPGAGHLPQWVSQPHLGYPGGHHGVAHSQAAGRQLLPQPAGTAAAQRESPAGRHPASLCRRRVHSAGGRSDQGPGLRRHLQQPGVAHLRATGRSGGEFPGSAPGRWSLPLRVAGRPDPEGSGGRSHRQRLRGGGDGGQYRRAA